MSDTVWVITRALGEARRRYGEIGVAHVETLVECPACDQAAFPVAEGARRLRWEREQPRELGDVVWPIAGIDRGEIFVGPRLAALIESIRGLTLGDVEVDVRQVRAVDDKPVQRVSAAWHAQLSALREINVTARAPLDREASSLFYSEKRPPCRSCGRMLVGFGPAVRRGTGYGNLVFGTDAASERLRIIDGKSVFELERHKRDHSLPGAVFRRHDVEGAEIWRLTDNESRVLCTSAVKDVFERAGATDIEFLEVGSVVD